ncbi:MAG TPA: cell division protein FtsZ, partial [Gaiellaceae bacterium]|nr:cell division protein FtsZ [Gaiellaceae bacterium]
MREGPLAELFRATEAAQRRQQHEQQQLPTEPAAAPASAPEPVADEAPPEPTPIRAVAPAPAPEQPAEERRPLARWLEPLPDQPARLERGRDSASYLAVIRVVGVGGAGLNAVDRMIDSGINQVDFVAVNTDIQQLQMSDATTKIHIGSELTEGLGSGADAEIGRRAADEAYDTIKRTLRGSDMVFVTAGEGGGTGSGAAPVVARVARELGALTVGIVTMPFKFEGTRRRKVADEGLQALREACDTLIVVPNDRLLEVLDKGTSMLDAFRIADDVLRHGVQG